MLPPQFNVCINTQADEDRRYFKDRSMKNAKHMFYACIWKSVSIYGQMEFLWKLKDNKNFFIPYPWDFTFSISLIYIFMRHKKKIDVF